MRLRKPSALSLTALVLLSGAALASQKPSLHIDPAAAPPFEAPAPGETPPSAAGPRPAQSAASGTPRRVVVYQTMAAAAKAGVNPAAKPIQAEPPAASSKSLKWYQLLSHRYAVPGLLLLTVVGLVLLRLAMRAGRDAA